MVAIVYNDVWSTATERDVALEVLVGATIVRAHLIRMAAPIAIVGCCDTAASMVMPHRPWWPNIGLRIQAINLMLIIGFVYEYCAALPKHAPNTRRTSIDCICLMATLPPDSVMKKSCSAAQTRRKKGEQICKQISNATTAFLYLRYRRRQVLECCAGGYGSPPRYESVTVRII